MIKSKWYKLNGEFSAWIVLFIVDLQTMQCICLYLLASLPRSLDTAHSCVWDSPWYSFIQVCIFLFSSPLVHRFSDLFFCFLAVFVIASFHQSIYCYCFLISHPFPSFIFSCTSGLSTNTISECFVSYAFF